MKYIIGSDEVGYGAWAGPLVVCAVAVPEGWKGPAGLNDSKAFKSKAGRARRARVYGELVLAVESALVRVENTAIDEIGLRPALVAAHTAALKQLLARFPGADVIVDGDVPIPEVPQARCLPKADATYPAVMAASIIAKVNRDYVMQQYHRQYPHYGWDTNAGYGGGKEDTKHRPALKTHGVTPLHRRSYGPVKEALFAARQVPLFKEP